ncbi:MAG TPA: hypothetical protein VHD87_16640 [Acidimicrobiales bacterium]|nr:hypothetical protein [Acidimicrobiales bacterium]
MSDVEPEAVTEPAAPPDPVEPATEMRAGPPARTAADGYAFAAVICAAAGLLLPIGLSLIGGRRAFPSFALVLFSAPAALLLARATEEPITDQPVSEGVARVSGVAQVLAYASLALVVTFCVALLLGILGRVVTN